MKKVFVFISAMAIACCVCACIVNSAGSNSPMPPFITRTITLPQKAGSVEIADVNGDKIKDLLIANIEDSSVTVLLGAGNLNFKPAKGSPFAAGWMPNDIAIADVNKDGLPDIVLANTDRKYLTVLRGDGKGGFSPLNGSPFYVNVRPHVHGVAVRDFNGDGNPDLVTDSWGNNQLAILFGNGKNGFNSDPKYIDVGKHPYQRIRVADLNNDGNPDIVTTNLDGNNATILLGDGKGSFREPEGSPFTCGDSPFGVAIADINGDGNFDLAIINSPSITSSNKGRDGLTILLGNGKGKFTTMQGSPFKTGIAPSRVAIGDVNGDGMPDIVVTNYRSNSITIFEMKKDKTVATYTVKVGIDPDGVAIADLDENGKSDIVVGNSRSSFLTIVSSK